jgi:site-specific recombinase XerD
LSNQNIVIDIKGKKQIHIKRTKTDVAANIPLLPKALEIIEKYKDHEFCIYSGKLLPTKSNQKQNAYLKEIATLAECSKKLTTHTARHTFATLMLTKGVSIETVSSMLGHTNIKTTQIYAKIIEEKVLNEMSKIEDQLIIAAG